MTLKEWWWLPGAQCQRWLSAEDVVAHLCDSIVEYEEDKSMVYHGNAEEMLHAADYLDEMGDPRGRMIRLRLVDIDEPGAMIPKSYQLVEFIGEWRLWSSAFTKEFWLGKNDNSRRHRRDVLDITEGK